MNKKGLSQEDIALWQYAVRHVRRKKAIPASQANPPEQNPRKPAKVVRKKASTPVHEGVSTFYTLPPSGRDKRVTSPIITQTEKLDQFWEKPIRKGRLEIDQQIDLHGYTRDTAHITLLRFMDRAIRQGARTLLIITGKGKGGKGSGVIRSSVPDWLKSSEYAAQIMTIRNAHPSHGGSGALYVILRRRKDPQ